MKIYRQVEWAGGRIFHLFDNDIYFHMTSVYRTINTRLLRVVTTTRDSVNGLSCLLHRNLVFFLSSKCNELRF